MKKIIVGIISFAFILVAFSAAKESFASSVWNGVSNDCPTVAIANYTTNTGYVDPCWPLSSVNASAGDSVNVRIYYHNTSGQTATNVRIVLNAPIGQTGSTQRFTGSIVSDQGTVSGSVTAYIPSTQKLSFGSTRWYPNQTSSQASFLNGQNGGEVINGGLNIGSISGTNGGWSSQGSVVVSFKVSNTVISNPQGHITVSPSPCYIQIGRSSCGANISWNTSDANNVTVNQSNAGVIGTGAVGSKTVSLLRGTDTFYLYNNSQTLDTTTVTTSCISGSTWNGSTCALPIVNNCSISNFTASDTSITKGDSTTLSWNTENCTSANISNIGSVPTYGSNFVYPLATTTYMLTAYGSNGSSQNRSIQIQVENNTCQDPSATNYHVSLPCTYPPQLCEDPSASNYHKSLPCTYPPQLCKDPGASNYNGPLPCTYPPQLCKDPSASNYNGSLPCTYPVRVCQDQAATNYGGPLPCTYPSRLCKDTSASNYLGYLPCVYPPQLCKDPSASNYNGALPCTYPPQLCKDPAASNYNGALPCNYPPRLCQDQSATNYGGALPCTYPSRLCKDTSASNYLGYLPCVYPPQLCKDPSASNYNGSLPCTYPVAQLCRDTSASNYLGALPCEYPSRLCKDQSANNYLGYLPCTYTVHRSCFISSFTASDTNISEGDSTTLRWNTENCVDVSITDLGDVSNDGSDKVYPDTDTTYTLSAYDSNGARKTETVRINVDEDNNNSNCSITSFTASDTSIERGDSVTLRWRTDECTDLSLTSVGDVNEDDSEVVYPSSTKTYVLTAYGDNNDKHTKSIRINVDDYEIVDPIIYNTNVITTIATNVSQTGASINGLVTSSNSLNVTTYFEYGTTVGLGQRTNSKTVNGNANFSEYLTGLTPNTIYYFRAISEGNNGTSRGSIEIFRTLGSVVDQTITKYVYVGGGTTVTGTASPIMLQIENKYETISKGDIIDYIVTYKNISKNTLTDSVLQVIVPKGISITNASEGTYSNDTHTLSVELDDLTAGEEGVVYVQGHVDSMPTDQAKIVSTAVLVYTSKSGAQENAIAYVLNVPRENNGSVLGASAFFSGFGGIGLIGWLLIIILILLVIILTRTYRRKVVTSANGQTKTETHY